VRDLIVKDDDLCIATHGRGFWIMDNITPLRQLSPDRIGPAEAGPSGETRFRRSGLRTQLFKPQVAIRVRWNTNTDTPLPPDEPAGENPPAGAVIDYSLGDDVSGPVSLEIKDANGKLVRRYSSTEPAPTPDPNLKIPRYWVRPPEVLSGNPGLHRFHWDLHGQPITKAKPEYPISAVEHETEPSATAPWALPGTYTVSLTTGGRTMTQPLTVKMDPRVKASAADLALQFTTSEKLAALRGQLEPIGERYDALAKELSKIPEPSPKTEELRKRLEAFANPEAVRSGQTLQFDLLSKVRKLFNDLQQVDAAPTRQQLRAVRDLEQAAKTVFEKWKAMPSAAAPGETALLFPD
jgi:hypothetical protein